MTQKWLIFGQQEWTSSMTQKWLIFGSQAWNHRWLKLKLFIQKDHYDLFELLKFGKLPNAGQAWNHTGIWALVTIYKG
jgi:hypothetical protein